MGLKQFLNASLQTETLGPREEKELGLPWLWPKATNTSPLAMLRPRSPIRLIGHTNSRSNMSTVCPNDFTCKQGNGRALQIKCYYKYIVITPKEVTRIFSVTPHMPRICIGIWSSNLSINGLRVKFIPQTITGAFKMFVFTHILPRKIFKWSPNICYSKLSTPNFGFPMIESSKRKVHLVSIGNIGVPMIEPSKSKVHIVGIVCNF